MPDAPDNPPVDTPPRPIRRKATRVMRWVGVGLLTLALLLMTAWAAAAVMVAGLQSQPPRIVPGVLYALAALATVIFIKPRRWGVLACAGLFTLVLAWFLSIQPSNDRDWSVKHAVLPLAEIDGDRITIRNFRHFRYRAHDDFEPAYEDRTFDLSKVRSADYIMSYWGMKEIGHAFVSFGFEGGEQLCISIETRNVKSVSKYSPLRTLFKQCELIYVIGDERDLVRGRTLSPRNDLYLYRLKAPPQRARLLLLDYLATVNELAHKPQFYNTLVNNCTTGIFLHGRKVPPGPPLSWEILLNGYTPRYAYDHGFINQPGTFEEVTAASFIDDRADAAGDSPDFSRAIRTHIAADAAR